jgi:hypothetical protein
MTLVHIDALISWRFHRTTKSENWIAECDDLGLTVQSSRFSELPEDISDTLELLFKDLVSDDKLDTFLSAHGWSREPLPSDPSDAVFDVPFELLMAGDQDGSTASLH